MSNNFDINGTWVSVSYAFHVRQLQADAKLREEEKRALRYLETRRECNSVQAVSITSVFLKGDDA